MAKMYFTNPIITQFGTSVYFKVCFKVVNDQGEELSLAGENSCGEMFVLERMTLAVFDGKDDFMMPQVYAPNAKDFLEILAKHLGYDVRPKYNEDAIKAEIRKGKKMNAIRLMRQMCTLTLKDAKDRVEEIARKGATMYLDVYLYEEFKQNLQPIERIFIRENGQNREISREEWNARFPDTEPMTIVDNGDSGCVFKWNIAHNLNHMADAAGIYKHLWRPEELGIERAHQLIAPLTLGLIMLKANPEQFRVFNPKNGCGTYENLVEFVDAYLAACQQYPNAEVSVSR